MFDLSSVVYKEWNERDIECPALVGFITTHPVTTMLDVGAHWSWSYYAPEVRKLVANYDAIDILPDPQTKEIVDKYMVRNVLDLDNVQYDLVACISTIEHAGISTYQVNDYY
ncbi:MAG: hypothetical protein AAB922_02090, partial [Patescibacteria group bacterium]